MPIWSLTKERVERLLKQIGDKELEIDELLKLTKEDLWKRDLDDFIVEWRFQLDDEAKRQKKVNNMTRRASQKLKIAGGGPGRKRKGADSDDSDFNFSNLSKVKKTAAPKAPKPVGGLLSYLAPTDKSKTSPKAKPKAPSAVAKAAQKTLDLVAPTKKEPAKDDIWMTLDGSGDDFPKATKTRTVAPLKKAAPNKQTESDVDEEIIRPNAGRQPRAAAAKPVKYNTLSDSDGDDMIFDVAKMVKGIGNASADNSRQLFSASASRPSSSSGLPKKANSRPPIDLDVDDTNYSMLAPPTTTKGSAVTARKTILSDDDDDDLDSFDDMPALKASKSKPAPAKAAPKPAPKPKAPAKAAPAKKTTTKAASLEPKKIVLSPAAKAYAAKKAKQAALEAKEDEFDKIADEIMDDDDDGDEAPAARRPGRRAAAAPKKWVISDDEDDEGVTADFDDEVSDD